MKRSEMLCYLSKIIRTSNAAIGSSHIDYEALAEDVLSAVEEQGMLPPFFHPFDTSLGESQVYVENYKWENEYMKATLKLHNRLYISTDIILL